MNKGTKLYSIAKRKCPKCHEGDFFEGSFFKGTVKEKCPNCNVRYAREPGFFQGSYYVSYALGVAVFVAIWVAMSVLFPEASFNVYLIAILGGILVMTPFMYPMSKIIWANFFFSYKQKEGAKQN